MHHNFVDSDIHEKIVKLLSETEDQIEWVEKLPVTNQENEEDCNKWLEHLIKVKIALTKLVNDSFPNMIRMIADKESETDWDSVNEEEDAPCVPLPVDRGGEGPLSIEMTGEQ
jgi:hypothetical protein